MDAFALLAYVAEEGMVEPAGNVDSIVNFIWNQITTLDVFQAVIGISFAMVCLLYGWRIFRILVVISFGMIGMFLGILIGRNFGNNVVIGGLGGLVLMALVSVPLMKWCVSVLGAMAGGVITGGIWYAFNLAPNYIWAGAIIGVVAGGLISFILLKASVMLFTSLGGSIVCVIGILTLLYQYEINYAETSYVHDYIFNHPWFLPTLILFPTIIGMIVQNKLIKHSPKWDIKS